MLIWLSIIFNFYHSHRSICFFGYCCEHCGHVALWPLESFLQIQPLIFDCLCSFLFAYRQSHATHFVLAGLLLSNSLYSYICVRLSLWLLCSEFQKKKKNELNIRRNGAQICYTFSVLVWN